MCLGGFKKWLKSAVSQIYFVHAVTGYWEAKLRKMVLGMAAAALLSSPVAAEMVEEKIAYDVGGTKMEGVLIYDDAISGKRPAVLVAPDWMGITEDAVTLAKTALGNGYVAFVADMYGADVRPTNPKEAGQAAGAVRKDISVMRARISKALDVLLAEGEKKGIVDSSKTAAIGFCFGGGNVLELARSGREVGGVVTFHGDLKARGGTADKDAVKTRILVLHGAADPAVPKADRDAFEAEMTAAEADWQMVTFANAVHSFTDPGANRPGRNMYDEKVAKKSFALMHDFFGEIF